LLGELTRSSPPTAVSSASSASSSAFFLSVTTRSSIQVSASSTEANLDVLSDLCGAWIDRGTLPSAAEARHLAARLESLQARVDVQLETVEGALALAEVARGEPCVLLRTDSGPRLVPWPLTSRVAA
jgi:hypothetical protein